MSGDPEQEYFADGIVEDIITALSRLRLALCHRAQFELHLQGSRRRREAGGRELGVRYVLEGSVRKSGGRVRITGQLIDAATGAHLWADRFDGALEDIFDLQDQMTASVVGAIAPKLEQAEIERAKRKPTERLDAYDYYLRGMANLHQRTRPATELALQLFYRAIELDPQFASAYGMAAWCYLIRGAQGWVTNRAEDVVEGARLAQQALDLGKEDAVALSSGSFALAFFVHDFDTGALFRIARVNSTRISHGHGGLQRLDQSLSRRTGSAIKHFDRFQTLEPARSNEFPNTGRGRTRSFRCGVVMTRHRCGPKRHWESGRIFSLQYAISRRPERSRVGLAKRKQQWHACAKLPPQ